MRTPSKDMGDSRSSETRMHLAIGESHPFVSSLSRSLLSNNSGAQIIPSVGVGAQRKAARSTVCT